MSVQPDPNLGAPLSFRGRPHVERQTGDVVFVAHMGLQLIPCRVKRRALIRFDRKPVPSEAEILKVFGDNRTRIEKW